MKTKIINIMPNKLKLFLREYSLSLSSEQLIVARRILEVLQSDKITLSPHSHQRAPYCPVLICREVEHSTRKKINGAVAYRDMVVKVLYLPEELLDLFNIDEAANLFFGGEDISVNRFIKFHLDGPPGKLILSDLFMTAIGLSLT